MEWDAEQGCFVHRDDARYEIDLSELGRRVAEVLHHRRRKDTPAVT